MDHATLPPSAGSHHTGPEDQHPGVIVVFSGGAPVARAMVAREPLELGRGDAAGKVDDGRVSRRHARVAFEDGRCVVTDLGSQNGTFADGRRAVAHAPTPVWRVIRIGDSLVVPCRDVRLFERAGVCVVDGFVRGPAMQAVVAEAAAAAAGAGAVLHVHGETGTGKEGIAQLFHRAGGAAGALIAVNCAAIPPALAERLLFGARRGAYSGAESDVEGYLQAADGGTLFLDEVAELDLQVQAKLLRVLESRELLPLGASRSRKVDFALCSAAGKDLRALVAAGSMREDLYFRIAQPAVALPALRDRPEEIPALIAHELARLSPTPAIHVSLVEQCLLRGWPGNVRELLSEIRNAAKAALTEGGRIAARHLAADAGSMFDALAAQRAVPVAHDPDGDEHAPADAPPDDPRTRMPRVGAAWRKRIEDALRISGGNIASAARSLGLHRTQLRRLVKRHGIPVEPAPDDADD